MKPYNTSKRLKQIMKEQNLKQVDILNMCKPYCNKYNIKLGKNDLSQYVNGKVEPGQEKLFILAEALNVSEAWLMGYDVSKSNKKPFLSKDSISYRIIALMNWKNISMDELAKQTNLDKKILEQYIYNTPDSQFNKEDNLLKSIIAILNTSYDTLFGFNKISDNTYENYIGFLYDKLYNNEPMTKQESNTLFEYISNGPSDFINPTDNDRLNEFIELCSQLTDDELDIVENLINSLLSKHNND